MIGSSSLHCALARPSRNAARAAISNGEHARIDVVVVAVDQRHLEVDHREAGEHAGLARGLEALLDAGMYSFGTEPPTTLLSKL
jgi:hypothetical protein